MAPAAKHNHAEGADSHGSGGYAQTPGSRLGKALRIAEFVEDATTDPIKE